MREAIGRVIADLERREFEANTRVFTRKNGENVDRFEGLGFAYHIAIFQLKAVLQEHETQPQVRSEENGDRRDRV